MILPVQNSQRRSKEWEGGSAEFCHQALSYGQTGQIKRQAAQDGLGRLISKAFAEPHRAEHKTVPKLMKNAGEWASNWQDGGGTVEEERW